MSLDRTYAVIMAGGGGTRLWPLSRRRRPKQSLPLIEGHSLFQLAVDRLSPALPPERILVITVPGYAQLLHEQAPELPPENILVEPQPRGTAPAIGYAAVVLQARDPEAVMACLTADHIIGNLDGFRSVLSAAESVASQDELVTLGIKPTYASTGYGYIHIGESTGVVEGRPVHRVLRFEEKPDREVAQRYFSGGEHAWNSGMFVWRVERILQEIERHMPELHSGLTEIAQALQTDAAPEVFEQVWSGLSPQTIDYGVMEQAEQVSVFPLDDLGWLDIGGWDRLPDLAERDKSGNLVVAAKAIALDTTGSVIYQTGSERLVAMLGIDDLVVVDTDDVLLICRREEAEGVRKLVAELSERGLDQYA